MRRIRIKEERLCNDDAFVRPGYRLKTTDKAKYGIEIVHGDVFYPNVAVYKPDGQLLFMLRKGVLEKELCNDAYKLLRRVNGDPSNRPGIIGERARMNRIRQDGKLSPRLAVPKAVLKKFGGKADMLGYYRYKNPKPGIPQCEPTAWTVRDFETYKGALPFIGKVDEVYRTFLPEAYAVQMRYMSQVPDDFKITGTAFTTLYVLKNAPTAFHIDDFDYEEAFGVMASLGDFRGSEICFPKFRVGVDYQPGDVLLADVHEMHGNFPLLSGERVACVFFVRQNIDGCARLVRETGSKPLPISSKS